MVMFLMCNCFFFFSSRRRHTRSCLVSWARRCVQETVNIAVKSSEEQHSIILYTLSNPTQQTIESINKVKYKEENNSVLHFASSSLLPNLFTKNPQVTQKQQSINFIFTNLKYYIIQRREHGVLERVYSEINKLSNVAQSFVPFQLAIPHWIISNRHARLSKTSILLMGRSCKSSHLGATIAALPCKITGHVNAL
eukprot:TRINITY_DN2213_c0_g3_i1.p1 TRINITY_DN2213_c0_g3~~TRINITY_DN2213_c0_g3_i1.p1  ORF type:complete len:195 (-),score=13.63 TRINITY_DN2213_c0_g3_i1:222-806(-)